MSQMTTSIAELGASPGESLVLRLKERDEAAFEEVFSLHKDMVYSLANRLLADKSEAFDVTQEVFLTLFKQIRRFRGECSLKTWLYRVTLNQAANRNRWWRRRFRGRNRLVSITRGLDDEEFVFEPVSREPTVDQHLLSSEAREAITEALAALPFEQRAAVVFRDVEQLSYEEIAAVVGVSVGTVKSRISRGRDKLRLALEKFQHGGRTCDATKLASS